MTDEKLRERAESKYDGSLLNRNHDPQLRETVVAFATAFASSIQEADRQQIEQLLKDFVIEHPAGREIRDYGIKMGLPVILAFANGNYHAGWQTAHDPAGCGHPRACWIDPNFGTPAYDGDEKCIMCAAEQQLAEARVQAEDGKSWKREFEMYRDAWLREIGGKVFHKHHFIDALVLTTRWMKERSDQVEKFCKAHPLKDMTFCPGCRIADLELELKSAEPRAGRDLEGTK